MNMRLFCIVLSLVFGLSIAQADEYPQPQFQRQDWRSLNGTWDFAFDDQNVGLTQNWQQSGVPNPRAIQVPFPFESALSGIQDTSEHPFSWYQKTFSLPVEWQGRKILLHFGAVHYHATVWLNGQLLGEHVGGQTPFTFELPALSSATNTLTIRCEHPPEDLYIARGKQATTPTSSSIYYTRTSGIWQSVWIEPVGNDSIESVHFLTATNGDVSAQVQLRAAPQQEVLLRLKITAPSGASFVILRRIDLGESAPTLKFHVDQPDLWSPGHGRLYSVQLDLLDEAAELLDRVSSYFGIRDVHVANGMVQVNGQSTYLKFVLDQGFWPDGIWSPPSTDALEKDIQATLAMGFNGVRKHQKLEDPRFLYLADKYGLLVSSEFGSPRAFSVASNQQFASEFREGILRDWNHPSIIMWVPANESWGYPDLSQTDEQNALTGIYAMVKQLDPSRLAIDNDGWQHSNATDLFAIHDYAKQGSVLQQQFSAFNPLQNPPLVLPDVPPSMIPGFSYNGAPVYLSEFGGIGYIMPGDTVPSNAWGYSGLEPDLAHASARITDIYSGLAPLKNVIGMCLTQLTDVEQETNGILTYHRVPKYDVGLIKQLNDSL